MTKRLLVLKKDQNRMQKRGGTIGFKKLVTAVFCVTAFSSASAQDKPIQLAWPVDCELGTDCWVARYTDHSSEKGTLDYQCGKRTQNAHNGTDIVLADFAAMARGVEVLAAAEGVVFRLRKGMEDVQVTPETRAEIRKRGCGNTVILRHAGGWQTQYCHMKQGSVQVAQGDTVKAGQIIGQVGLSGLTEFPHLHFMVRAPRSGTGQPRMTDPFDGGRFKNGLCESGETTLWEQAPAYQAVALLPPLMVSKPRTLKSMWDPQPDNLGQNSPALIVQARAFGALKGDEWHIQLTDPGGKVRLNQNIEQARDRQVMRVHAGIRKPDAGFRSGIWRASVRLVRDGAVMEVQTGSIRVE